MKMTTSNERAKQDLHMLYLEKAELKKKMNQLAEKAFPVGSFHICTNWKHPVEVEIIAVYRYDNIKVKNHKTGREYHTYATALGVKYL